MAAFLDICRFLPTAGGTTDWTYAAAVQGYQSPAAAGAINGRLYKYRAESADLAQWEIGEGAYATSTGTLARTTILFNSAGTTAKINFSAAPQVAVVALKEDLISIEEANAFTSAQQAQARTNIAAAATPGNWTRTVLSSGSGTYTTKTGCKALLVRMLGGGGGGGGGSDTTLTGGSGGVGGNTTFGTSLLTAGGGSGGGGSGGASVSGGTASGGDINIQGGSGPAGFGAGFGSAVATSASGSNGGNSAFGGGASGGWPGNPGATGGNAPSNTGGGGGGGGGYISSNSAAGGGGAAGAYCEKLIVSPAASYAYAVGTGGAAGAAGTHGGAGGVGGSGLIIIDEYY